MLNLGYKRLIVVLFTVVSPIAIYFVYNLVVVNRLYHHLLMCSMAIAFSYAVLLTMYVSINWAADGFKK